MIATSLIHNWGSTLTERTLSYPCDQYLSQVDDVYFRAVDVHAPASVVFRWLCQLKAAPYSYDWLDNLGHQSPRKLLPGLENLEPGQRVMTIFRLVDFERDRHLTMVMARPRATALFGTIALSYVIYPQTEHTCRLVAKFLVQYPSKGIWTMMRLILPLGDLIMMRKQLLTLKNLAEHEAA
jgi:hypothetical protein